MSPAVKRSLAIAVVVFGIAWSGQFWWFYFRDNFATHFPAKVVSAASYRSFEIPWWNPFAGAGQPLAANPNLLTFYPDNVLYLVAPVRVAFNLHFVLHLLGGALAMRALLRENGITRTAARIATALYLFSGIAVSTLSFYNLVCYFALIPWSFYALQRLFRRRDLASLMLLGSVMGLMGLAAEPVTIISTGIALAVLAARRVSGGDIARIAAAAALALIIAAPQLIAFSEIAGEVERASHRFSPEAALSESLRPARLLEIVGGPFLGLVTVTGPKGYQSDLRAAHPPPLFNSLFLSALIVPALVSSRAPRRYQIIATLSLFIALGKFNPVMKALVESSEPLRIIRYPEKFLMVFSVAAVVLIGRWLVDPTPSRRLRAAIGAAAAAILLASLVIFVSATPVVRPRIIATAAVAIATLALAFAGRSDAGTRRAILVLLFVPLLFWFFHALPVDAVMPYSHAALFGPDRVAASPAEVGRLWRNERGGVGPFEGDARFQYRVFAATLLPNSGSAFGVPYLFERSPDGMYSFLSRLVRDRVHLSSEQGRARYLRMFGCRTIISPEPLSIPGTSLVRTAPAGAGRVHVYKVDGALPDVRIVHQLVPVRFIQEGVAYLESPAFDEVRAALGPSKAKLPLGSATITSVRRSPNRWTIDVETEEGATLLVNETYFRGWRARTGNGDLSIVPLNIDRLGIIVPAGRWSIMLEFQRRRGWIAAFWVLSAAGLISTAFLQRRRRSSAPSPYT